MKKRMTISEFSEYCSENKPHRIDYDSRYQTWFSAELIKREQAVFHEMKIYENLDVIIIADGLSHRISLAPVKFIDVEERKRECVTVARVSCGDRWCGTTDYTFLIS